ncbi:MAG TPA: hypothetical protein EYQ50_15705 [Verrucomicrobiales bacterium]|nr:hypothetical protein [Verrucomicrobiales bacterium]
MEIIIGISVVTFVIYLSQEVWPVLMTGAGHFCRGFWPFLIFFFVGLTPFLIGILSGVGLALNGNDSVQRLIGGGLIPASAFWAFLWLRTICHRSYWA